MFYTLSVHYQDFPPMKTGTTIKERMISNNREGGPNN